MATDNETNDTPLRVFLTGGDSRVGLAFIRRVVQQGANVVAATPNGTDGAVKIRAAGGLPVYPDLTRAGEIRSVMQMSRADVVVHLTGLALNGSAQIKQPYADDAQHLEAATSNLAQVAGQLGVQRLIYAGPAFHYGDTGSDPISEDAPLHTDNAFTQSLAQAEAAVLDGGLPGVALRCGVLYGAHSTSIDALVNAVRKSRNLPNGSGVVSWLHAADLVNALVALLHADDDGLATVYNVAGDDAHTYHAFTQALAQAMGVDAPGTMHNIMEQFRVGEVQRALLDQSTVLDTSKLREALEWQPQFASVNAGLEHMLFQWRADEASDTVPADETDDASTEVATS